MIRNTAVAYGSVSKFFHWTIAVIVIGMLSFGFFMASIPKAYQPTVYNLHKVTGIFILSLMVMRLIWACLNRLPACPPNVPQFEQQLGRFVHLLLYVFLFVMPLAGWIGASAAGRPPVIGDWHIALPITGDKTFIGNAFTVHNIVALVLITLVSLHGLAALYHHYWRRDNILKRMLPGNWMG